MSEREKIVEELKKLARQLGKTPGQKVFLEKTGLNIWHRMKYWENYGALVQEAGLKPNEFDKTKYSEDRLCELIIKITRDKSKFPTRGMLDVLHHNKSDFPSSSTFYNALGLKPQMAKRIIQYIEDKPGYDDILQLCNTIVPAQEITATSTADTGFVYLGKQSGKYKIGKTSNLDRRRGEITLIAPDRFKLIHSIETDDPGGIEKYWHNRFKEKWERGEWFKLSRSDIAAFKRWKKIT